MAELAVRIGATVMLLAFLGLVIGGVVSIAFGPDAGIPVMLAVASLAALTGVIGAVVALVAIWSDWTD